MSKKRRYQTISVKDDRVEELVEKLVPGRVVVGIDIAKTKQFAAFATENGEVHGTVRWEHPVESPEFLQLLVRLRELRGQVEVVMEPSGTYGDALRAKLLEVGFPVYRINPKRTHDAAEVFDGVPSSHDAKSAAIITKLHLDGLSETWPLRTEHERGLSANLRVLGIYEVQARTNINRLEAILARHWPELPRTLELKSATLLELLIEFGSPGDATSRRAEAEDMMRKVGGPLLRSARIQEVLDGAATSFGLKPTSAEQAALVAIALETRRCLQQATLAKRAVEKLTEHEGSAHEMSSVVGKTTAAVLVAAAGDPNKYHCAAAYRKTLGLNLKEHSSGEVQGGLHITKRGSGIARQYLYMAALRLVHSNPVMRAWYDKKVQRQGGQAKIKAIIAIMRKLALALWHVAKGNRFDATKLFDTSRLQITEKKNAEVPA